MPRRSTVLGAAGARWRASTMTPNPSVGTTIVVGSASGPRTAIKVNASGSVSTAAALGPKGVVRSNAAAGAANATVPSPTVTTGGAPTISSVTAFIDAGAHSVSATSGYTLVAFVGAENGTPTISGAVTWTQRASATGSNYPHNIKCWTGPVTSTGTQSITIGGPGTVDSVIYVIPSSVTVNTTATGGSSSATSQAVTGLTTTVANALLLGMWGTQFGATDATANYTPPSGMTERADSRNQDFAVFASFSEALSATVSGASRTATSSNGGLGWSGVLIALT